MGQGNWRPNVEEAYELRYFDITVEKERDELWERVCGEAEFEDFRASVRSAVPKASWTFKSDGERTPQAITGIALHPGRSIGAGIVIAWNGHCYVLVHGENDHLGVAVVARPDANKGLAEAAVERTARRLWVALAHYPQRVRTSAWTSAPVEAESAA